MQHAKSNTIGAILLSVNALQWIICELLSANAWINPPYRFSCRNKAMGFFVFDFGCDRKALTTNPSSVLIRSLSINPAYQGQGIGRSAMQQSMDYIRTNHPNLSEIVLSVNCNNQAAYRMYLNAGFIDTGKQITGAQGKQHVMSKSV